MVVCPLKFLIKKPRGTYRLCITSSYKADIQYLGKNVFYSAILSTGSLLLLIKTNNFVFYS